MPRQSGISLDNNFRNGLVTDFTALSFPENACTDTYNCQFELNGSVKRRLGFDFESNFSLKTIDRANNVVSSYLWKNVAGNGDLSVVVMQVGNTLYFYKTDGDSISEGAISSTVTLSPVTDAPSTATVEAQYSDGNGLLFVTHPYCEALKISYDTSDDTVDSENITIQIRDFEGVDDSLAVNTRPNTLSDVHSYNLFNQGWADSGDVYYATSEVNLNNIGGNYTFGIASGQTISAGERLIISKGNDFTQTATGTVVSYSGTSLVITLNTSSTIDVGTNWIISRRPPYYNVFFRTLAVYPSNSDVWWHFKNAEDVFDVGTVGLTPASITPAPKGHFIVGLYDQDRTSVSGVSGIDSTTTEFQRASTSAFFAGRVFYSGINYNGFNSKIYFTQIIERPEQYGFCFQTNDPTSENLFDLLPSDGGVISIPDAGTIHKLHAIPGGLVVFAENGTWFITGSTGLGFVANDYTVQKISSVGALTATSFVDIAGYPAWWNSEGIYIMTSENGNIPSVKSLTDQKIKDFYREIPLASKRLARGYYHNIDSQVRWLYKSESTDQITDLYAYDRILNFNVQTGAFYPWTITDSDVKVHGIFVSDFTSGAISIDTVIDGSSNTVIDSSGNQIIAYSVSGTSTSPRDKFIVSYPSGGSYLFTFAENSSTEYLDWFTYDTAGEDFTSYFITGFKIKGEGIRKFQSNWTTVYSKTDEPVSYYFQGIWDYALTGSGTGRWSSAQYVNHLDTNYSHTPRRLKIRGHGKSLQFKVTSVTSEPFHIVGWSSLDSVNQLP